MKSIKAPTRNVHLASTKLYKDVAQLLAEGKSRIAVSVNVELTLLNWNIGRLLFIKTAEASYGKQIVATVSQLLMQELGKGFTISGLSRMINLYKLFPDKKIVATLSQQLSWSHFAELIAIKTDMQREFYTQLCIKERWCVRVLCSEKQQEQIELLELNKGNIKVAEYFTQLPPKKLLAKKLNLAIKIANNQNKKPNKAD